MTVRIKTVYLDMDGVIASFDGRWKEVFNETPNETRELKKFNVSWEDFVKTEQFASLPTIDGWNLLIEKLSSYGVNLEILSSSGGEKYHKEVSEQKRTWLKNLGIDVPTNFVTEGRLKAKYATANTLLIDDTLDVILSFHEAGGHAILHDSTNRTIKMLDGFFKDDRVC